MKLGHRKVAGILVAGLLAAGVASAGGQSDDLGRPKARRWESNLSVGGTSNHRLGLIKGVWWYALPDVLAIGLGLDGIFEEPMWFSVNVALNAPLPVVRPFICAGSGGSLSGTSITRYGGGLKIRLTGKFGLIAEYRRSRYTREPMQDPGAREKVSVDYFGGGIHWAY